MARGVLCALLLALGCALGRAGEYCHGWSGGAQRWHRGFQCPERSDGPLATLCCGSCSLRYCCSAPESRLDQGRCPGEPLPSPRTPVPGELCERAEGMSAVLPSVPPSLGGIGRAPSFLCPRSSKLSPPRQKGLERWHPSLGTGNNWGVHSEGFSVSPAPRKSSKLLTEYPANTSGVHIPVERVADLLWVGLDDLRVLLQLKCLFAIAVPVYLPFLLVGSVFVAFVVGGACVGICCCKCFKSRAEGQQSGLAPGQTWLLEPDVPSGLPSSALRGSLGSAPPSSICTALPPPLPVLGLAQNPRLFSPPCASAQLSHPSRALHGIPRDQIPAPFLKRTIHGHGAEAALGVAQGKPGMFSAVHV
ncbi:protein shisa-1-like [Pseudopipra pipra]|uniref:protein shisa-1-like n=1 Tax=Pseudopipra pipra TaxID=415032 RepID=UPI0031391ADA